MCYPTFSVYIATNITKFKLILFLNGSRKKFVIQFTKNLLYFLPQKLSLGSQLGWGSKIPDPGVKKTPDPGSGSATLSVTWIKIWRMPCLQHTRP
jgi:hypothetical protein